MHGVYRIDECLRCRGLIYYNRNRLAEAIVAVLMSVSCINRSYGLNLIISEAVLVQFFLAWIPDVTILRGSSC